ncbi:MAG: hypothetical protein L0Y55_11610 [Anaerolineales bacterium]|nr:hypothetical protein [Anaerolineales bacterium]
MEKLRLVFLKRLNLWIALALVVANLYAWTSTLLAASAPYVVAPIRAPQVVALLERIDAGKSSGEVWQVTLTELEAEQTITWYLQRYPQIPFAHPRVKMTPDYVSGEGDATIAGLRVHIGGKARVTLKDGLPVVQILDLSLPLPPPIRQALEDEMRSQLRRADALPVRFTSAEWRNGVVVVRGVIR